MLTQIVAPVNPHRMLKESREYWRMGPVSIGGLVDV